MSTPDSPPPFDPHDFPADLVAAQRDTVILAAELEAHAATLPWSREPHPGWPKVEERGREHEGRPESPGWTPEETAEYDRLRTALLEAATTVYGHPWWARCAQEGVKGPDMVKARQALRYAPGAVPDGQRTVLDQEDVDKAA
ncbi:hypothetical protein ACFC51_32505 [Streptomyces sp. NPDC055962]|uniref:hypothetical protein n=1 Tax=Streptomyces sp. NPDC055962 TaxID=3345667 RepID=UPI0035D682EE